MYTLKRISIVLESPSTVGSAGTVRYHTALYLTVLGSF